MDLTEGAASVCLFGKPALFIGGRLKPFGGPRKAIALLAYLLLHRERALSRAAIAEHFWPDEDNEAARASLRRHLYRALAALPQASPERPWILADKVTVRWNPEAAIVVDTHAYERYSAAGDLAAAVALYRGDYLEELGAAERELGMLESACRHLEDALERSRAVDAAKTIDCLIEVIHAYVRCGRCDEALAAAAELLGRVAERRGIAEFPALVPHAAAAAYAAAGRPAEAAALRAQAKTILGERASRIRDERAREGYVSLYFHREILAESAL